MAIKQDDIKKQLIDMIKKCDILSIEITNDIVPMCEGVSGFVRYEPTDYKRIVIDVKKKEAKL